MKSGPIPPHVYTQVAELASAFESVLGDLFVVTKTYDRFEFEMGLFGYVYLKPNKRLSKIFATDKEIVALFTTFSDQQQRTISALQKHILGSRGRLENTIAILVHPDPEGNLKLKAWGREQGIAVIPILATPSVPDTATLERDLLLDFFANDPFDVTGPVSDDARFYGRRTEAVDLARQLQRGQIKACLGIRKIGKTSILNRILHELRASHDSLCVMVDCSRDDVWSLDAAQLLRAIALGISAAKESPNRYADIAPTNEIVALPAALRLLAEAVRATGRPVVLLLDEVDYITPGSPTAGPAWRKQFNLFWRNFRATVQECARSGVSLSLFVSGVSSKWFRIEAIDGIENSALAFIPEEYLSPLAANASAAMVRSLGKVAGLSFDEDIAEWIGQSCGHLPYWTRKACSYVHRHIDVRDRPLQVPKETAERLVKDFIDGEGGPIAEVALNHLFRVFPDLLEPAKAVLNGLTAKKDDPLVATLLRYGVFTLRYGNVQLGSLMMEAGLRRVTAAPPLREFSTHADQPAPALKLDIGEWADELAQINAVRNRLEKRLRALTLNFVKFAALQKKDGATPSVRLLKALEPGRVEKLKHLPPDDLIEKFLWTELARLTENEWPLFQPVFHDLRLFKEHSSLVNDRPDAHAKDADAADLALYRRSLRWLEEAVQRVSA